MATCFIIGAAGKVGQKLTRQLSSKGHTVTALYRKPEQAETLHAAGAKPVAGDIQQLSVMALADLMTGHDVAVFTADRADQCHRRRRTEAGGCRSRAGGSITLYAGFRFPGCGSRQNTLRGI